MRLPTAAACAAAPERSAVIAASSLGTVFEWYDFYLYGLLAATTTLRAGLRCAQDDESYALVDTLIASRSSRSGVTQRTICTNLSTYLAGSPAKSAL